MVDINARINWMPGMELTAETFSGIGEQLEFRQQLAIRAALGSNRMGLVPDSPFICNGIFVKNRFEVTGFRCTALLPSGRMIDADEDVQVTIPMLFGNLYYLTVGFSDEKVEFEKKGVPFIRPHYIYGIHTIEEVEKNDLFPLLRFHVARSVNVETARRSRKVMTVVLVLTLIPAAYLTVNIVRDNVKENKVNDFVTSELEHSGVQILSTRVDHDTLRVVAVGKEITDREIAEARERMHFYGIGNMELRVIQASNEESFALATSQLTNAERTNSALSSQIADLQRQLAVYTAMDTLSVHVSEEARTLFPTVESVAVGRLAGKPVALVMQRNGQTLTTESMEKLEAWLHTRLMEKELEVVIK